MAGNKNKILVIGTVFLVLMNILTLGFLWMSHYPPLLKNQSQSRGLEILTDALSLDEDQKAIFKKLRQEHFDAVKSIKAEEKTAKDAFFEAMTSENAPDSMVLSKIEAANVFDKAIDRLLFEHYKDLLSVCDDKQKEKLRNMFADMIKKQGPPRH
jgi:periplasmic protein CpxP/Spy